MKVQTRTLEPEIGAILGRAQVDGRRLVLREQLDRKTYTRVAKVLAMLGGKWDRAARAHMFDEDAAEVIADAVMTGSVVDLRKTYQAFATPRDLADELVWLAGVRPSDVVLEPSAGTGRIVEAVRRAGARAVMCEIQERHHEVLAQLGSVIGTDFLGTDVRDGVADKVVANPPFARGQDVAHVTQMAKWLAATGGVLVSVMSPAWTFRKTTLHSTFRAWAEEIGAQWSELPSGAFAEAGTSVRAGIFRAEIRGPQ